MHRHVTHQPKPPSYNDFCRSVCIPARGGAEKLGRLSAISVTDNFRVINPADFGFSRARGIVNEAG